MPRPKTSSTLKPVDDDRKRNAIIAAIANYDVSGSPDWAKLEVLSTLTSFEEIDAVPEGIFETTPSDFEVVATVFVKLNYGSSRKEKTSMSDSYPAFVKGTYDESTNSVSIDNVSVDTSSSEE